MKSKEELVHIFMITYNHENFIAHAIESVLMQKTTFNYKLMIGEDCSTDRTAEIVKQYTNDYPNKITSFINKKNLGIKKNAEQVFKACTAKYLALFEGDDYWTDPLKLQKQVDLLEANSDYSLSFHNALILWDDKSKPPKYFCSKDQKETSNIDDVIEKWFIPSISMVFRKDLIFPLPEWYSEVYNGDWALHMLLADKGKIGYIDEVMGVYRMSLNPFSLSNLNSDKEFIINQKQIDLLNTFNNYTNLKYEKIIANKILALKKQIRTGTMKISNPILYFVLNPKKILRLIGSYINNKYYNK
jgi:glycosyltransferase involved in cell wall biosynthesis